MSEREPKLREIINAGIKVKKRNYKDGFNLREKIKRSIPGRMLRDVLVLCLKKEFTSSSWIWHVMIYTRFIAYYNKLLEVPVAWIYKFFFVVHIHTRTHTHTHTCSIRD